MKPIGYWNKKRRIADGNGCELSLRRSAARPRVRVTRSRVRVILQMLPSSPIRCLRRAAINRYYSTSRTFPSSAYTHGDPRNPAVSSTPTISQAQHDVVDSALRVDQAGEIAATWIYKGQIAVLGRDKKLDSMLQVFQASRLEPLTNYA